MSKRKPLSDRGHIAAESSEADPWRRRVDSKLAGLFHAALEEPIPDDMLRLVRMIGAQSPSRTRD